MLYSTESLNFNAIINKVIEGQAIIISDTEIIREKLNKQGLLKGKTYFMMNDVALWLNFLLREKVRTIKL